MKNQIVTAETGLQVIAFLSVEDEDGRSCTVDHLAPNGELPWKFSGTIDEIELRFPEWQDVAEHLGGWLAGIAVFPAGSTDVEDAIVPKNVSDDLRERFINGWMGRYSYVMNLP